MLQNGTICYFLCKIFKMYNLLCNRATCCTINEADIYVAPNIPLTLRKYKLCNQSFLKETEVARFTQDHKISTIFIFST